MSQSLKERLVWRVDGKPDAEFRYNKYGPGFSVNLRRSVVPGEVVQVGLLTDDGFKVLDTLRVPDAPTDAIGTQRTQKVCGPECATKLTLNYAKSKKQTVQARP